MQFWPFARVVSVVLPTKNKFVQHYFVSRGTIDPLGRKIKSRASALIRGTKQMCSIKLF
jgi:hypothetical protein